jgi:Tol biopolymer transport system component
MFGACMASLAIALTLSSAAGGREHSATDSGGSVAYTALDPPSLQYGIVVQERGGKRRWLRMEASEPSFSADGTLAFSNGDGIWIQRPGFPARRLVSDERFPDNPALSPNGSTIAYDTEELVWTVGANGDDHRKVLAGREPSWAPDGRRLVLERNGDLVVVAADGSKPTLLARGGTAPCGSDCTRTVSNEMPAWSPDGREIAFVRDGDVYTIVVETSRIRRLTRTKTWEDDPVWAPDGGKLAFSGRDGDLYLIDRAGSRLRRLTRTDVDEIHAAWRPDGLLAFAAPPDPELFMRREGASRVRVLTRNSDIEDNVEWSPERGSVSFTRGAGWAGGLYVMNSDGSAERRVGWSGTPIWGTDWSPDGARIVVAAESGLSVLNVRSGSVRRLTRSFAYDAAWSPDGRRIAFVDGPTLYTIGADGTGRRRLARAKGDDPRHQDFGYVDWGASGRIAYSLEGRGAPVIVVTTESGRVLRQLYGASPNWSPDGRWLAFVERGIRLLSADGKRVVRCTAELPASRRPDWGTNGRLAFVRDDGIWTVDACGSSPVRIVRAQHVGAVEAFG